MTVKRRITCELSYTIPANFPDGLAILIPDLARIGRIPSPEELLFFDLETTGLSGGAGTLAFLAAFGRFMVPSGAGRGAGNGKNGAQRNGNTATGCSARIEITQYLLLDYPGETDFIDLVVKEFAVCRDDKKGESKNPAFPPADLPVMVSFNGKCFDSQILKNRCLMNGIMPPDFYHADLLHPARRLWKRILPDCSQATIEVSILGLNRKDDVSGALAPDIWFSFLRNNDNRELLSICDHNVRDINGLASIFLAFCEIATTPFESRERFKLNGETLALAWREALKRYPSFFNEEDREMGKRLLETAAENGCPEASFALGFDFFKNGRITEGRVLMKKIAGSAPDTNIPDSLRAAALRSLAIDAEWRLGNLIQALCYTNSALDLPGLRMSFHDELEKRRGRLEERIHAPDEENKKEAL